MTIVEFLNSFFPEGGWFARYLLLAVLCYLLSSSNRNNNVS